eukprot:750930-Hanusia_phi.AAC.7
MAAPYGTVGGEPRGDGWKAREKKMSMAMRIAPVLGICAVAAACVVVVSLRQADRRIEQVSDQVEKTCLGSFAYKLWQDLYAFKEDNFHNRNIVWNGRHWIHESTGKRISMQSQRTQKLFQLQALADLSTPAHPNYDCCYIPKTSAHNGGVHVAGSSQVVESGMFCHMAIKNLPSGKWPMVRVGSLREAGVTSEEGQGNRLLANHKLHHCRNDLIFKSQDVAILSVPDVQMLSMQ